MAGDGISDDYLKREYLNYLKWTEPLALMLELVEDKVLAERVVRLALEVDWKLGARLAGAVKPEFQQQTITLVDAIKIPQPVKIELLSITRSSYAVQPLIEALKDEDSSVRSRAAEALREIKSDLAVQPLIEALKDEDSSVRSKAAEALGKIKSDLTIQPLIEALKDEDSSVRSKAAETLGEIQSDLAVQPLIQALKDENHSVRSKAAEALREIKSDLAVQLLIQVLKDENSSVRSKAAEALGEIKSDLAVQPLIQVLKDENSSVRSKAAEALGKIKSDLTIQPLIEALKDEDSSVRSKAAETLGEIKSNLAVQLLIEALKDEDSSVRSKAAEALREIKSGLAVKPLIEALKDEYSSVRSRAVEVLGKNKSDLAVKPLIKALKDEYSSVRSSVAYALREIQSDLAVQLLIEALKDENSDVRYSAADVLREIKSDLAVQPLIEALKDEDSSVRSRAAEALREIKSDLATQLLIEALKDEDSDVRYSAADVLREIKSDLAVKALIEALKDENSNVRYSAADVLREIKSDLAVKALIEALKDENFNVRYSAADALGDIKSDLAVKALIEALKDENSNVRSSAAEALREIKSDLAVQPLIEALKDEDSDVRSSVAYALREITSSEVLPDLTKHLQQTGNNDLLNIIAAIQERYKFYNYTLTQPPSLPTLPESQPELIISTPQLAPISVMYILHLSDLHFGTTQDANNWHSQISDDLRQLLSKLEPGKEPHLNALIISGDIANKSLEDEYKAAELFINRLIPDFGLKRNQIVIVPGNHDLNWQLSDDAYTPVKLTAYQSSLNDREIFEKDLILDGNYVLVPEPTQYEQRFKFFSKFYETIKGEPYPLSAKQQYELQHFTEQDLLILGLNSAWKLNHDQHYKSCASINNEAVTNALNKINENPAYKNSRLKIAVWHHPLNSPFEDRIKDHDFMQRLAQNGFRLALHGHIHQAGADDYRYRRGSQIDIIAAGTFGAPVREWVPGYPLQYNLLKWQDNKLTVYTRKRIQLNGAWQPDAMWVQEDGINVSSYYEIELFKEAFAKSTSPNHIPSATNRPMSVISTEPIEVFFSYSHRDEDLRDELAKHLKMLERQGAIAGWHDRQIGAGTEWAGEIDEHLKTARIILLLISSDFIASDYCYDIELKQAIERHDAGEARVIPVILRPVDWRDAPFGKLQALPKDGKAITTWGNRDQAFMDVAQGIRAAVKELKGS